MKRIVKQSQKKLIHIDNTVKDTKVTVVLERDAHVYISIIMNTSRELSLSVVLRGVRSHAEIAGVMVGNKDAKMVLHTLQHHKARKTTSNLLVKSVLFDASHAMYNGNIQVDKKAQQTNAYQQHDTLLLSDSSHTDTNPGLEIIADNVRCTHGATIATISGDELYYLRTRGLSEKQAKHMIIEGYILRAFASLHKQTDIKKLAKQAAYVYNTRHIGDLV